MNGADWGVLAGVAVSLLLGLLTVRATKRSTTDAKAANELQARDRLLDANSRLLDQVQEERDRLSVQLQMKDAQLDAKDGQLHHALEQVDMLTGQNRALEELVATLRRNA